MKTQDEYSEQEQREREHVKDAYQEQGLSQAEAEKRAEAAAQKIPAGGHKEKPAREES